MCCLKFSVMGTSDPSLVGDRPINHKVPGVLGGGGFEKQDRGAVFGDRVVLDAAFDDVYVALLKMHILDLARFILDLHQQ